MLDHRIERGIQRTSKEEGGRIEQEASTFTSLHEQAQHYLLHKKDALLHQKENPDLGKEYGESIVRGKMLRCAKDPEGCAEDYLKRRKEADRPLSEKKARLIQERIRLLAENRVYAAHEKATKKLRKQVKRLHVRAELEERDPLADRKIIDLEGKLREAEGLLKGRLSEPLQETTADALLIEEVTQEAALRDLDKKIEQGLIDPASLNAQMWLELELPDEVEKLPNVTSVDEIMDYLHAELAEFTEKGFLTPNEAKTISEYGKRYANVFAKGFEKKHGKSTLKELFELTRDNARKVTYQTKMDKRTLAGSDHGVRHIYEGNTHFAEQMMDALRSMKGVDFKSRDEILIRQIIIDHDMGYTTYAAMTKDGGGAAKDHPCIGCRYVESNAGYYTQKFGKNGYDVVRDVLLHHSYPSSRYKKERPEGKFTYNRDLIRSVVSSSDSLSTTHETKAMGLFRFPEAIDILQNLRLYADRHDGHVPPDTLEHFRQDFYQLIDTLVANNKISSGRAKEYRQAVERKLTVEISKKTFGQFAGVVRRVELEEGKDQTELRLVVHMETSRLQALVADAFGDPVSIAGFKKAMEAFGMHEDDLKRLGKVVGELQKNPRGKNRKNLQQQLVFVTDRARFIIGEEEGTGMADEREEERLAVLERFENFHQETARDVVKSIFDDILALPPPRSKARLSNLSPESLEQTFQDVLQLEDAEQQVHLKKICRSIHKHLDDKKNDALEALFAEMQRFLSKKERTRLANKLTV